MERVWQGKGCQGNVHILALKTECSEAFLKPLYKSCEVNFHLQGYILSQSASIEVHCNFALAFYENDTKTLLLKWGILFLGLVVPCTLIFFLILSQNESNKPLK